MEYETFKKRIMRRVYVIYSLRKLCSPAFIRAYVLTGIVWYGAASVSVADVFNNTPSVLNPSEFYRFYSYAIMHTETLIKVALVAGISIASWMAFVAARKILSKERDAHEALPSGLTFN